MDDFQINEEATRDRAASFRILWDGMGGCDSGVVAAFIITVVIFRLATASAMVVGTMAGTVVAGSASMMTQAGAKFLKSDSAVFVIIQAGKDASHALGIRTFKGSQGSEFVKIKTAVFTRDLGKFFLSLGLEGSAPGVSGGFLFFVGEFAVAVSIEFRNVLGTAFATRGTAGFLGRLAFFFVNHAVLVEVKLLKNFGEFAVTEGAMSGDGGCDPYAQGNCEDREVFDLHGSFCA
ncbi:MAG: hypothetical protein CMN05_07410 [Roseibacillus sp.]|nr:hypothetical protein [Roseibacillus sp.]MDP7307157.1 hypothetical protein [Roseibacillus sp.]HJM65468.1 hypothetical protein [Roseibacillus sp.]